MQHNQKMLQKNARWTGQNLAQIVCVALDDEAAAVHERVRTKRWDLLKSYWAGEATFESSAPTAFGLRSLPHCVLVHRGRVLWSGHPAAIDLEAAINAAIDGTPFEFPAVEDDADEEDDEKEEEWGEGVEMDLPAAERVVALAAARLAEIKAGAHGDALHGLDVVVVAKSKLSAAGATTTAFHFALSGTVAEKDADTRTFDVNAEERTSKLFSYSRDDSHIEFKCCLNVGLTL